MREREREREKGVGGLGERWGIPRDKWNSCSIVIFLKSY